MEGNLAHREAKADVARGAPSVRFPGRRPGPQQREEYLRIWDAMDVENRKALLFLARQMAKEVGLVPPESSLMMTDRVF